MKIGGIVVCCVLAAAACGCGGKKDSSSGSSSGSSSTLSSAYARPRFIEGTEAALAVRYASSDLLKEPVEMGWKLDESTGGKLRGLIADAGLADAVVEWCAVSVRGLRNRSVLRDRTPPDFTIAVAVRHSLPRIEEAMSKNDMPKGSPVEIEGVKGLLFQLKSDFRVGVVSLEDQLLLVSPSREMLQRQIALYRDGKGESSAFTGLDLAGGAVVQAFVPRIGELLAMAEDEAGLPLGQVERLPGGRRLGPVLRGAGDLRLSIDGSDSFKGTLEMASSQDATRMKSFLDCMYEMGRSSLREEVKRSKAQFLGNLLEAYERIEIQSSGTSLQVGIPGIVKIVVGSLFPAVDSAMLSANTSAMAMRGRNLFVAITEANTEREAAGLASVWPKSAKDRDEDTEDIAGMAFSDSAKYFEVLFDVKNNGTKDCQPYVKGFDLSILAGCGVPKAGDSVKSLEGKYVAWSIAKGVRDEMDDMLPVLVSRNFDPALLLAKWDGYTDGDKRLPIRSDYTTPFGDKAIVVVRKGGAAEVIKAQYLTYRTLYKGRAFDATMVDSRLTYLTPSEEVVPKVMAR